MTRAAAFFILLFASTAHAAWIEKVVMNPPHPTNLTPIVLTVSGSSTVPADHPVDSIVTVDGSTIRVEFVHAKGGGPYYVSPWSQRVQIPALPAGDYDLKIRHDWRGRAAEDLELPLVVRDVTTFPFTQRSFMTDELPSSLTVSNRDDEIEDAWIGGIKVGPRLTIPYRLGVGIHDVAVRFSGGTTVTARNAVEIYDPEAGRPTMDELVLIPFFADVDGAGGTRWMSYLQARAPILPAPSMDPPRLFRFDRDMRWASADTAEWNSHPAGLLLRIDARRADEVRFSLWIRESRGPRATIPVVRSRDFLTEATELRGVRFGSRWRVTLRLYSIDAPAATFEIKTPTRTFTAHTSRHGRGDHGFASIDLSTPNSTHDEWDVAITPLEPAGRYWAFITAVESSTNAVTVITPE